MASSLSNLADNLAEGIHNTKCKDCDHFLKYESVKDNLIKYKCLSCNKNYSNKAIYLYECRNEWEKFNETILPEKEEFYSNLNMEDLQMQIACL